MESFPSTSSAAVDIPPSSYDLLQLSKLVESTLNGTSNTFSETEPTDPPGTPVNPALFHLHTFSLEANLTPPATHVHYRNRERQPNEAYTLFDTLRTSIFATPPLEPLTLIPPSRGLLRIPLVSSLRKPTPVPDLQTSSGGIFFPRSEAPLLRRKGLVHLPRLNLGGGKEWMPNTSAWDNSNWLHAAIALDAAEPATRKVAYKDDKTRFILETGVEVVWFPPEEGQGQGNNEVAELALVITIQVYVDLEALATPLPDVGTELVGLILHSLIPTSTPSTAKSESEARAAALRYFFECMRPAPYLPRDFPVHSLQPQGLVSTLHPFQMRTVAFLLQREQAASFPGALQIPVPGRNRPRDRDPDGWWADISFGDDDRRAFRRATGSLVTLNDTSQSNDKGKGKEKEKAADAWEGLSEADLDLLPTLVDLSAVRGSMLCEEMGLGKTMEAIALVLLHRHPLSTTRSTLATPSNGSTRTSSPAPIASSSANVPVIDLFRGPPDIDDVRIGEWVRAEQAAFEGTTAYDPQAQLPVTQVGTTLIVTPQSLLKQWVAEMRTHAPHLRVCVYEGWRTLQRGVERQKAATNRSINAKIEAKRKRQSESLRRSTVKKYSRTNGGSRVKIESDDEGENEDEDEDEDEDDEGNDVKAGHESLLEVTQRQFVEYVRAHDVVITTYNDLSSDINVAVPVPPRSRRANVNYKINERPRSPMVMVEWWRVIMDEVQLHSDTTDAAYVVPTAGSEELADESSNMVALIPRKNSLAVSGTPAKSDIKDLMGSLRFLRVPVIPHDHRLWHRLQQPSMRLAFEGLFRAISVRTTKKEVTSELHIPRQTRYVVPIDLSEIELHYYNDTLDRQRERLRPRDGVIDKALIRACLLDLRQICTHIQVGQMQERGARAEQRLHLGRELMTMADALEKMRDDHSQDFLIESRLQLRAMIKKAKFTIANTSDELRHLTALNLYEKVRERADKLIQPVREHLAKLLAEGGGQDDDSDVVERRLSQKERERATKISSARTSIRELLVIVHQSWFFEGDIHHEKKEEEQEVHCYTTAEGVRKEILAGPLNFSNASVEKMHAALQKSAALHHLSDLQTHDTTNRGGILTNDVCEQINNLLGILNDNALLVYNWRKKIIELLSSPVEAQDENLPNVGQGQDVENPDNEFYAEALKAQGDVEAYLIAYAAAVADRREMMVEERSLLAAHDSRLTKQRQTQAAINATIDKAVVDVPGEVAEQASVLLAERQVFRDARKDKDCERPLKAMLMDLNTVVHGPNRVEEIAIAERVGGLVKKYIARQTDHLTELNKELDLFRKTFNKRVKYFAALQEISDSVSTPEFRDLPREIDECSMTINFLEIKLARMVVKGRFLQYLGSKEHQTEDDLRDECIICMGSSDDQQAVLLACGHFFCISCFRELRRSSQGRKCPSCRTIIDTNAITKIKLSGHARDGQVTAKLEGIGGDGDGLGDGEADEPSSQEAAESSTERERRRTLADLDRLKEMPDEVRREVAHMDMMGEYGSKINFLIKHLLWYRSAQPDARHVIFSNWSDSLNIVTRALQSNDISFVSFDQGRRVKDVVERFHSDKSIMVFLLHAERESSGLTLTSCRVVHLLEPVLRHSFELQAIGRVDRLGQKNETSVYCYATRETVESRILSQGVRNGTSIYLKDAEGDEVVAEMSNVVSAAHKGGDVSNDTDQEDLLKLIL